VPSATLAGACGRIRVRMQKEGSDPGDRGHEDVRLARDRCLAQEETLAAAPDRHLRPDRLA